MNKREAVEFLREHQPLPPTRDASNELLKEFDEVRRLFMCDLDGGAVPLLIGALGEGDGHGIYQMVETTLQAYPEDVVLAALKEGLQSRHKSVRYWSAQFAASYPSEDLLDLLAELCRQGDVNDRIAAVTAMEVIGSSSAKERLRELLQLDLESPVRQLVKETLGEAR